ncbi:LOW QUALITY PROTEIN: hypothetical protein PanWU01x14_084730 [Parasponia andersonii]|uniref:Retrovirus-related Pol polyprotein from transposon TNT 1-94-like beta-barrel domain-containing protein n=1 Tax=Parasponia andersonii TaxID=3476 RepID=A0A2P5D9P6_PARAD|nr:LOW QUALITY PROTEIN: hypothetical protein PanWU01x14_084730 [Parasponia andersonii]
MGQRPLPSLRETFSEVRREATRKKVMMGTSNNSTAISFALAVQGAHSQNYGNRARKERPWCDHCRKPGHTKDKCWMIHGKSADWKPSRFQNKRESRSNIAAVEEVDDKSQVQFDTAAFSKEQLDILQRMFGQLQPSATTSLVGTGTIAQKGNFLRALNAKCEQNSMWIVDSGAFDHMTGDETLFHSYSPSHGNFSARIADGTLSQVAGTGSIVISKDIVLKSVLLVLKLSYNLLSISKITRDMNCVAKFSNTCFFSGFEFGEDDWQC